jgi:hypothetical protein
MCTLYSQVKAQAEIRALINAIYDTAGNLEPQPAPVEEALKLQRPLPDKLLQVVATGEKKDAA